VTLAVERAAETYQARCGMADCAALSRCAAKTRDFSQRPDPDSLPDCSAPSLQPTSLEEHLHLAQAAHDELVRCVSRHQLHFLPSTRGRIAAVRTN
jgi:hypothetical protein